MGGQDACRITSSGQSQLYLTFVSNNVVTPRHGRGSAERLAEGSAPTSRNSSAAIWRPLDDIYREESTTALPSRATRWVQREVNDVLERGVTGHRSKALSEYLEVTG